MSSLRTILLERIVETVEQQHSSAKTSLNQISTGLKNAPVKEGDNCVDVGGGKYDKGVEHFASKGAKLHVYDPYNRSKEHNDKVEKDHTGKADYVGCHNVLNVIKEKEHRAGVLDRVKKFMGPHGKAHVTVYEGDKSGNGRETKGGESWQNHQPTSWYHDEIKHAFPDHQVTKHKGGYLIQKKHEVTEEKMSMTLNRFAVVNPDNKPRFITDDEKNAKDTAKRMPGHEVRKIFAPRKPAGNVIPIKAK